MDTSETYIRMRLTARKDLLDGIPPKLDWDKPYWVTDRVFVDSKGDFYYADSMVSCQLERQDQLQEMVFSQGEDLTRQAIRIAEYREEDTDDGLILFNSWEQWWLAFVMKERYSKTWNGEDWV